MILFKTKTDCRVCAITILATAFISFALGEARASESFMKLREVLVEAQRFAPLRMEIDSSQQIKAEEGGEMVEVIHSQIVSTFGASMAHPATVEFKSRKSLWRDGASEFYVERKKHIFGKDFFAVLREGSGAAGELKADGVVEIYGNEPASKFTNGFEAGYGFLLKNQMIFDKIPLLKLLDVEAVSEGVSVAVEGPPDSKLVTIVFERADLLSDDRDVLTLDVERNFSLLERRFTRTFRRNISGTDGLKASVKDNSTSEFRLQINDWVEHDGIYMPVNCLYEEFVNGVLSGRIKTKIRVDGAPSTEDLEGKLPSLAIGTRVIDKRIGVTYQVGPDGPDFLREYLSGPPK